MKIWHLLAVVSGTIIAVVMAFASISYNATLGTAEPAFGWLPLLTNAMLFASLALAFDLGMVASVFGFLHWRDTSRIKAFVCAILFVIASAYSVHSVRGYIATNLTLSQAPAERSADLYASLHLELRNDQDYLAQLRTQLLETQRRSARRDLENDIEQISSKIQELRTRLAQTDRGHHVAPLAGIEWFLAITLWFFNATCWSAWFGYKIHAPPKVRDTVVSWLAEYDLSEPENCGVLYETYQRWCSRQRDVPLAKYSFYARLVELGAKKFRDGRNGPTKYVMSTR
jgi:hypothetical protein